MHPVLCATPGHGCSLPGAGSEAGGANSWPVFAQVSSLIVTLGPLVSHEVMPLSIVELDADVSPVPVVCPFDAVSMKQGCPALDVLRRWPSSTTASA